MVVTEEGVRYVAEILVRKVPDDRQCIDLRVCILGSADVGKSTLLGNYICTLYSLEHHNTPHRTARVSGQKFYLLK